MSTKRKPQDEPQDEPELKVDGEQPASEDGENEGKNSSTSPSEVVRITLEEYLRKVQVHPGLLASFKVEAANRPDEILELMPEEAWEQAFQLQAQRVYE